VKLREESGWLHAYDRVSGLHVRTPTAEQSTPRSALGPAVLSLAVTYACDLACPFCYAPKDSHEVDVEDAVGWCRDLDALGTLEVALGGGEPFLYQGLHELCARIWNETAMGVSITTNGQHIDLASVDSLRNVLSILRVSIDAPEPVYSTIRQRSLEPLLRKLRQLSGLPIGINTVVNSLTLPHLDETFALVRSLGAVSWLLLPEVRAGKYALSRAEWKQMDLWLLAHWQAYPMEIPAAAAEHLTCPVLLLDKNPRDYAHIGADAVLRRNSHSGLGVELSNRTLKEALGLLWERQSP